MKLSLIVLTPGKMEGKAIPIKVPQFVIGRDPQCNLRPASALISKRRCALLVRNNKVFIRDFDSTNSTRVNNELLKGERELHHEDQLAVGPLLFRVVMETTPAVSKPTPMPPTTSGSPDDEAAAALLLSLQEEPGGVTPSTNVDSEGIPTGNTVMDVITPAAAPAPTEADKGGAGREQAAKTASGNTSSAAKAILEKYMRRPRSS